MCYGVQFWKAQTQLVQLTFALSVTSVLTCGAYKMDHVKLVFLSLYGDVYESDHKLLVLNLLSGIIVTHFL